MPIPRVGSLLLSGCLAATPALGQQASPTVPRDLVTAYLRMLTPADSASAVEFLPGQVPPALEPSVHLPNGSQVVGTISVGGVSTVLASVTLSPDSVLRWFGRSYNDGSWETLARTAGMPLNPRGGFRSVSPPLLSLFCRSGVEVSVSAARTLDGFTLTRLRIASPSLVCAQLSRSAAALASMTPSSMPPLPILFNPENVNTTNSNCYVVMSGPERTSTQYSTLLSPAAVFDHYAKQLTAAGWSVLAAPPDARGSWTKRDTSGAVQVASLTVGAMPTAPNGCITASLDIMTSRNR